MSISRALDHPQIALTLGSQAPSVSVSETGDATRLFSQPLAPMAAIVAVSALTLAAIKLGMSKDGIVVIWLANAVGMTAWLRIGQGRAFDFAFGAMMALAILAGNLLAGYTPRSALLLGGANFFEMAVGVLLVRRFATNWDFRTVRSALRFICVVGLATPLIGAVAGSIALTVAKGLPLPVSFEMWAFGHSLGMLLVAPALISLNRSSLNVFTRPLRLLEWVALIGALELVSYLRYTEGLIGVAFILNFLLVAIAVRLRITGLAVGIIGVAVFMFEALLHSADAPTTISLSPESPIVAAQLTLLSVTLPFMLVAALLSERDALSARARLGQIRAERASEAKSRLLANVAHEIKSPVAGVIGIGEMWSSGSLGPVTQTQEEMARMLVKTARQVETLAHDLLDVARAESGAVKVDLRPTDVVGVIQDISRSTALRPDARDLKIAIEVSEPGLVALADSQRLTQVIDNLATNAVKYGAAGGVVTFRARRYEGAVRIEVVDQGPGLTPQKQAQLFEPFNRLGLERSAVEGHGIGLALSKRLIELMGGVIGVASEPDQGATFWIELPSA